MSAISPTKAVMLQPKSLTHQHLLTAVNTELQGRRRQGPLRILDAGCGDGQLMAFLQAHLARLRPNEVIDVHGFEVHDSQSDRPNFLETTGNRLSSMLPDVPWLERIELISVNDAWPYANDSFDVIVSNQVMEHVIDLRGFLAELARVIKPGGISVHVFPLRNAMFDGHVRMPLVHRIDGFEQREAMTRLWATVGVGTRRKKENINAYANRVSGYLHLATVYRRLPDFVEETKRAGLKVSYRYTQELYMQKVAAMFGSRINAYRRSRNALIDWAAFAVLRHVSSVTLVLERSGKTVST